MNLEFAKKILPSEFSVSLCLDKQVILLSKLCRKNRMLMNFPATAKTSFRESTGEIS